MREIRTEIPIKAPAARVWQILIDFGSYPSWNPFIKRIEGRAEKGTTLKVWLESPGGLKLNLKPRIRRIREEREFRWLGHLWFPGIFDGEHYFELIPSPDGGIRFVHHETFSGLLVPLIWHTLNTYTRRGFEAMNRALKERAESI